MLLVVVYCTQCWSYFDLVLYMMWACLTQCTWHYGTGSDTKGVSTPFVQPLSKTDQPLWRWLICQHDSNGIASQLRVIIVNTATSGIVRRISRFLKVGTSVQLQSMSVQCDVRVTWSITLYLVDHPILCMWSRISRFQLNTPLSLFFLNLNSNVPNLSLYHIHSPSHEPSAHVLFVTKFMASTSRATTITQH